MEIETKNPAAREGANGAKETNRFLKDTSQASIQQSADAEVVRVPYDAAKSVARMARAKQAHDSLIAGVHRAQAHALEIRARAEMRLAEEYDAAQERGEVATGREGKGLGVARDNAQIATAADLGLRRDEIHEARKLRDAETSDPGLVRRSLDAMIARGIPPEALLTTRHEGATFDAWVPMPIAGPAAAWQRRKNRAADLAERMGRKHAAVSRSSDDPALSLTEVAHGPTGAEIGGGA